MPPKVTARQTLCHAEALIKEEPHLGRIALTLLRDKVDEKI
jgi:hypothetical protein